MRDIFGDKLNVGDTVAFNHPGYKTLTVGNIVKFTAKMVTVQYTPIWGRKVETTSEYSHNLVKKHD